MNPQTQLARGPLAEMLASQGQCGLNAVFAVAASFRRHDCLRLARVRAYVLAAMIWLGGWATLSILATQALRHKDPGGLARFAVAMRFVGPRLFAPATVLVAGLGVWLVLDSHQWHFHQLWSELAIGLFAGVLVIGAGFQSRAAIDAERAIAEGNPDRARGHVTHWAWGSLAILLLLIVTTWDMTVKP